MKKLVNEVLSLVVPMAIVINCINRIDTVIACVFGLVTVLLMVLREHKHPFVANAVLALMYCTVMYFGAVIYKEGFSEYLTKFTPLMLSVAYLCTLIAISCIAWIIRARVVNHHLRALAIFSSILLLTLALGCVQDIAGQYGILLESDSLTIMLIISALGIAMAGYSITRKLA